MTAVCGVRHHRHPDTVCTRPPGHYQPDRDPHAGPLIIGGRECGGAAWDEPKENPMPDQQPAAPEPVRHTVDTITSDALTALYAERDMLGREADRLRRDWVQQRDRADRADRCASDRLTRINALTQELQQLRTRLAAQEEETMRQHDRAEAAEATVARVQALADRHPAGIDTAHLHAAIANTPSLDDDEPDLPPFVNRDFISHRPQQPTSPAS